MLPFSVKRYWSKSTAEQGAWRHVRILLKPVKLDLAPTESEDEGKGSDVSPFAGPTPEN